MQKKVHKNRKDKKNIKFLREKDKKEDPVLDWSYVENFFVWIMWIKSGKVFK